MISGKGMMTPITTEESITDYIAVNSEQENPLLTHFFNGSYTATDIMRELITNRSLLPAIDRLLLYPVKIVHIIICHFFNSSVLRPLVFLT